MRIYSPAKSASPHSIGGGADETAQIMHCARLADSLKVLITATQVTEWIRVTDKFR
jgi:hypothetical protein